MTKSKTVTNKIQVLFTAFEAVPFSKTGGLGDVAGTLPKYIKTSKYDVRVMLPLLSVIPEEYKDQMEFMTSFAVPLGWRMEHCGIFRLVHDGVTYYFLDNEYYFYRGRVYGEFDDGERVAYFSKAVCESLMHIEGFAPDIVHCNDWHTALVPVFLREHYQNIEMYQKIKLIFTIHNLKFQGKYDKNMMGDVLGLAGTPAHGQLLQGEAVNFLQAACLYSDRITTVSPTYAQEICTPYFGEGLDWLFESHRGVLSGILNGIDYKKYDPEHDKSIAENYSVKNMSGKTACKLAAQARVGLPQDPDIPLFVIVSRLTEQKGLDLVTYNLPVFTQRRMQLLILGLGEERYESAFKYYAKASPEHISAQICFSDDLSRIIYAGADVLLMPSRFEPCGLSQMMAMRYGCLPLVRETGGLKDTVQPYNCNDGSGTGFSFANFNAHEFMHTIDLALDVWYNHHDDWEKMQHSAMTTDYSWLQSAKTYRRLYSELAGK